MNTVISRKIVEIFAGYKIKTNEFMNPENYEFGMAYQCGKINQPKNRKTT
jgi:hypothetical protein